MLRMGPRHCKEEAGFRRTLELEKCGLVDEISPQCSGPSHVQDVALEWSVTLRDDASTNPCL